MANNQVALLRKDITDSVNNKLTELQNDGLVLPPNYNASNALKSAFFKLQETKNKSEQYALDCCTRDSIADALLDMVVQGLSPMKTQCYFIVYGQTLKMKRSYFGTQAVLKSLNEIQDIWANVIYKDDVFKYENDRGRERLISHETAFENRDKDILGAYAVVLTTDGQEILTVMTKKEIEVAWGQSKTGQAVHKKFPQEMSKRTVINRAAKAFINTSNDNGHLAEAINRTTENEYENGRKDMGDVEEVKEEIENNANKGDVVDFDEPKQTIKPKEEAKDAVYEDVPAEPTQQQDIFEEGPGF